MFSKPMRGVRAGVCSFLVVAMLTLPGCGEIAAPDLVGRTQAEAVTALTEAGLTLGAVTESYSATVPAGQVISQNPAAGTSVASGSAISLNVSKGPEPVSVPGLAGLTRAAAVTALTEAGLTLGAVTESYSATVPAGQVISQDPAAGASVASGSAISLNVSKGPEPASVPDLAGLTRAAAETALTGAGLVVGTVTEAHSETYPVGQVFSQDPAAGMEVAVGSSVDLVLSLGSAPVNVPDANLAAAIRVQLGLAGGTPLTGAHLRALTMLVASYQGITDLTGLEHAANMTQLILHGNTVTGLGPLSGLVNLRGLYFESNQIEDLGPLSGLVNLGELNLGYNKISDLSPLSGITSLHTLYLYGNEIVDLEPLSGLTGLVTLSLFENQITDVAPLSGLVNLADLNLATNQIVDVTPLSELEVLRGLNLGGNKIVDVEPLSGLAHLFYLNLIANQITTVASFVTGTVFTETADPPSMTLENNPLVSEVCETQIPALQERGVTVYQDACVVPG